MPRLCSTEEKETRRQLRPELHGREKAKDVCPKDKYTRVRRFVLDRLLANVPTCQALEKPRLLGEGTQTPHPHRLFRQHIDHHGVRVLVRPSNRERGPSKSHATKQPFVRKESWCTLNAPSVGPVCVVVRVSHDGVGVLGNGVAVVAVLEEPVPCAAKRRHLQRQERQDTGQIDSKGDGLA